MLSLDDEATKVTWESHLGYLETPSIEDRFIGLGNQN